MFEFCFMLQRVGFLVSNGAEMRIETHLGSGCETDQEIELK